MPKQTKLEKSQKEQNLVSLPTLYNTVPDILGQESILMWSQNQCVGELKD